MTCYALYNKKNEKRLIHPKIGQWFTPDIKEAENMLAACNEYLKAIGASFLQDDFVIIDAETGEEC